MSKDKDLDKTFDFRGARSNPYARELREAKQIRITKRSADGSTDVIVLNSVDELAALARQRCGIQLDPEQVVEITEIACRRGISYQDLIREWLDYAIARERAS